ncbi:pyrroline-5-carboxylate reductase [Plantibacter sp. VKM Ac-2876]|uniref:pyrroline-5-carboxylate reductase n=1 Tax=Plantibacter sp. VKM Ac-2876 TaxID=2783826 RepID=UPI00188A6518|nr:pyrroline-5-carboxylate reductase [Plantibacter sp. VKM Ac-2876]
MSETISLPSIAILGAGSMGGAVLRGLVQPGVEVDGGITVTNRTIAKAEALAELPGVTSIALEQDADGNRRAAAAAKIVLIGVKPYLVADLLAEIADALQPGTIVVSLAAGIRGAAFEAALPESVSVLRSMPNTPSYVGLGVTGLAPGTRSSEDDLAVVTALFETVGQVVVIPESKIDALSAISGSGPAYVYYLIEELTRTAIGLGFTPEQASVMVDGTFRGATELLATTGESAEQLRVNVTSPKGTTERALAVLAEAGFSETFDRAAAAAIARAEELSAS